MNWKILSVEKTLSTNEDASESAKNGAEEGTVIWAQEQTAGRGRQGRVWTSVLGESLCFSMVLRPSVPPGLAVTLPLVAGIAVARALEPILHQEVSIKWPNDVLICGKKICGILCEMHSSSLNQQVIILGVGLNVNLDIATLPPEVRGRATSMSEITGTKFSLNIVLGEILSAFETLYRIWQVEGFAAVLPELQKRDALLGRTISIALTNPMVSGIAVGIQADGALLIRDTSDRMIPVYSGEAHIDGFYDGH